MSYEDDDEEDREEYGPQTYLERCIEYRKNEASIADEEHEHRNSMA